MTDDEESTDTSAAPSGGRRDMTKMRETLERYLKRSETLILKVNPDCALLNQNKEE